jgi:hypothetical protein
MLRFGCTVLTIGTLATVWSGSARAQTAAPSTSQRIGADAPPSPPVVSLSPGHWAFGTTALWTQDPVNACGGLSSQDARNPGGLGWFSEVADNFTADAGWNIDAVRFYGGYCNLENIRGNTEGFTIRFYTDSGGSPGTRVFEQDVLKFNEVLYYEPPGGLNGYRYLVELNPPFEVSEQGQYWVSVVALLARGGGANEPQWGWVAATSINPPAANQWFFSPGNFTPQGNDVAYSLFGSVGGCDGCDANCDGTVDAFDIEPFIDLLLGAVMPCASCSGDANGDGVVDAFDIEPFINCLVGP